MAKRKSMPPAKVLVDAYNKWEWETRSGLWPEQYLERQFLLDRHRKIRSSREIAERFMVNYVKRERRIAVLEREILAYEDMRRELLQLRATVPVPIAGFA